MSSVLNQALTHESAKIRQFFGYFGCVLIEADGFVCPHVSPEGAGVYVCMHTYVKRRPVGPGDLQRIERSVKIKGD